MHQSHIPQYNSSMSHNAPFCNRNVHVCTFLLQNEALWDLWDYSIALLGNGLDRLSKKGLQAKFHSRFAWGGLRFFTNCHRRQFILFPVLFLSSLPLNNHQLLNVYSVWLHGAIWYWNLLDFLVWKIFYLDIAFISLSTQCCHLSRAVSHILFFHNSKAARNIFWQIFERRYNSENLNTSTTSG